MERYWSYNIKQNNYIPTVSEPLSAFPTIIDTKRKKVWCRSCHRWENILAISQNALKTGCGRRRGVPVPDEERFCFFVAKDSMTLKIIGSAMSNCVGWGYAEAVRNRRATIVYAMHKGKYKICIEVTPDFTIRQAFGPHNQELDGEAFEAYSEWCQEKHIVRRKAFSIHCAPRR